MKIALTALILVLAASCSNLKSSKGESGATTQTPEWVYSPMVNCTKSSEMCASGDGNSFAASDATAKKSLASIFETQIKAEFSTSMSSNQQSSDPETADLIETTYKEINEVVDQSLQGVQIKERAQVGGVYYSLAMLDKRAASDRIKKEMQVLDKQMELMLKKNKRSLYKKLLVLYEAREALASRYHFLTESKPAEKITIVDINEIKYGKAAKAMNIKITTSKNSTELSKFIKNILAQVGHKVVEDKADLAINIDIKSTKEFFNVNGFEKFTLTLNINSVHPNGSKVGSIVKTETAVGRSEQDVIRKVLNKFKIVIDEQLEDLNID